MFSKRIILLFAALIMLTLSFNFVVAQDTATLRELADQADFYIGAAVYTYHLDNADHAETLAREFNMLTPENEAKFCELQPLRGLFDFNDFDELVAFAELNDMSIHGHTLLWHQCMPSWLTNGDWSRDEAIELMRDHIYTVVGRYQGRVPIWDVVNEGITDDGSGYRDTPWHQWIGDDYIELAFQFAHEADPNAILFYNDYGAEGLNAKSNTVYQMVRDFVERGVPIHGVGLQAHFSVGSLNAGAISQNIQRLGELGLEVQLTEVDVRYTGDTTDAILQRQAGDYYNLLNACLENEACTAFITWGVSDQFSWLRGGNLGFFSNPTVQPLMFTGSYEPKPAYFAVSDLLARHVGAAAILDDAEIAALTGVVERNVEIPPPTMSDPAQLSPDSVTGVVYYAPFPVAITLDGEIDDWENVPRVTVNDGPMIPQSNDTSFTFAAAADDTHLYFLADVQDSVLVYGTHDPASGWYEEDSVEFYINATGNLEITSYRTGVAQIGFLAANIENDDPTAPLLGGSNSGSVGANAVVVQTATGYRIEASIPLENDAWTITPENLANIGFQVHLNGSSAENRDTKLIWSIFDTQDQSWTNPSLFGQLIFWDVNE